MHVGAVRFEIRFPLCGSLKHKRKLLRPVIEGCGRYGVAVAEVDHQDTWQRSAIGVAAVAQSVSHVSQVLDAVDRFVWSNPELEVLSAERSWLDRA